MFRKGCWAVVAAVCLMSACRTEPQADAPPLPLAHVDAATAGSIRGSVRFEGRKPVMEAIDFSSNPTCEREHHGKRAMAETVVINANGTLRNTFVWIKSGLPKARWEAPETSVKLDQDGCVYHPHVLALMVGQDLEVLNSDEVNHNVHLEARVNPSSNDSEHPRAESIHKRFSSEEIFIPVTCSVHPWMRAYIAVVSHPFFAVTGDDGSYELKGVPPGDYVVETVHEKYGRREQRVTVGASQAQAANFVYAE
jgi:plastocyanin